MFAIGKQRRIDLLVLVGTGSRRERYATSRLLPYAHEHASRLYQRSVAGGIVGDEFDKSVSVATEYRSLPEDLLSTIGHRTTIVYVVIWPLGH